MPVYVCRPGQSSAEPWKHGVQVYARPFPIDPPAQARALARANATADLLVREGRAASSSPSSSPPTPAQAQAQAQAQAAAAAAAADGAAGGAPVRRVRHSEVVLSDEVSVAHGRYWLRLRWPGSRGGVAGYIALGTVADNEIGTDPGADPPAALAADLQKSEASRPGSEGYRQSAADGGGGDRDRAGDLGSRSAAPADGLAAAAEVARAASGADAPPPNPFEPPPRCEATGLYFPSSAAMVLLRAYDDGLGAPPPARRRADSAGADSDAPPDKQGNDDDDDDDDDDMEEAEDRDMADAVLVGGGSGGGPASPPTGGGAGPAAAAGPTGLDQQIGGIFRAHQRPSSSLPASSAGADPSRRGGEEAPRKSSSPPPSPPSLAVTPGEPVFCRICREGLHDVNYDLDPVTAGAAAAEGGAGTGGGNPATPNAPPPDHSPLGGDARSTGPLLAPPPGSCLPAPVTIVSHHPSADNPLLSPCSCTGSMAFVHYMCIEQWRCRSRHPAARNGLNCETCKAPYSLPPPATRPSESRRGGNLNDDDWLEAMPAHVLAALRRPHVGWQVGTAIVRRRWLRPFAPVVMSPIVALYCRARRTLKKRGVSRRRWACSLCRRRARWKCVRCLRSYYCSRPCQNVSWHIAHKHLCYKRERYWQSWALYLALTALFFPGVLSDPLVYDVGLCCLLGSFMVMGVIGGGIATLLKKGAGVDIRGRTLEGTVVAATLWYASVAWGLAWGFFGDTSRCHGVAQTVEGWFGPGADSGGGPLDLTGWGSLSRLFGQDGDSGGGGGISDADAAAAAAAGGGSAALRTVPDPGPIASLWRSLLFRPAKIVVRSLDRAFKMSAPALIRRVVCEGRDGEEETCTRTARGIDPDFFLGNGAVDLAEEEDAAARCASDIGTVSSVLVLAGLVLALATLLKQGERVRRRRQAAANNVARGPGRGVARAEREGQRAPRPHQD